MSEYLTDELLQAGTNQLQHTTAGQPAAVPPPATDIITPAVTPDIGKQRGAVLGRLM